MAKSGAAALAFTENLHAKVEAAFKQDNADLMAFYREQTGTEVQSMKPWNVSYWSEKMRVAEYDFDEQLQKHIRTIENR